MADRTSDFLANERTFLAWVRTSLGLIGLGFVLARMGLFLRQIAITAQGLAAMNGPNDRSASSLAHEAHAGHEFVISGVIFLAIGVSFCFWSAWAYHRNRLAIAADQFQPARLSIVVLSAVVVIGGLVLVALVLWRMLANDA
jgi:putative membrane protein